MLGGDPRTRTQLGVLRGRGRGEGLPGDVPVPCFLLRLILHQSLEQHSLARRDAQGLSSEQESLGLPPQDVCSVQVSWLRVCCP